jgi:NCS1 family nucleobase:cation symporter-1
VATTSATVVLFGEALWDPVVVLSRLGHPLAVMVAMVALVLATLNVNVTANVVSPANDFSNLYPRYISFKMGGLLTCFLGLLMQPWKLLANYGNYIIGWLVGYSSFLGPVAGVMIADYYVLRRKIVLTEDLYQRGGFYEFSRGFNWKAVAALAAGVVVALVGLVVEPLTAPGYAPVIRLLASIVHELYHYAWFIGFGVSFLVYLRLMRRRASAAPGGAAEPR